MDGCLHYVCILLTVPNSWTNTEIEINVIYYMYVCMTLYVCMCARQLCEHMDGLAGCAKIHIHVDMHSTSLSSHHRVKIDPFKPKQKVTICDFSI